MGSTSTVSRSRSVRMLRPRERSLARITGRLHSPLAAPAVEVQAMRPLQESLRGFHRTNFARLSEASRRLSGTSSSRHASINDFDPTRPAISDSDDETRKVLFTAGFVRSIAENSEFTGTCMLCSESDTVLALLLREPPCSVATPGFPLLQSSSKVAFPLAMGNFAETDILSLICCDACASVPVKDQAAVYGNRIIAALPLVPYSENKQAYETRLKVPFQDKFADDGNALVFIAVLYVQILKPRAALSENDMLFVRALKWAYADLTWSLSHHVLCPHNAAILSPKYSSIRACRLCQRPPDMDPLSVVAGIIPILKLSVEVLAYLNDVKDAPKDRTQCAIEISNIYGLLFNLRVRIEDGDFKKPWYTAILSLAVENGALDQFKQALEMLQSKMTDGGRLKKAGEALMWKFKKEEVASILDRMERLKSLVDIALQMDHFSVGVAYVYCNYKTQEEQDTTSLLAAILKQLVQARPSTVEPVERLHEQHADRGTMPSLDEVFGALRDVLAHYPTIYIVTDALDECRDSDGRRQFLAKLRELQAVQDIRLMATSRSIPEVMNEFREALSLEVQASNEDVKRFVAGQTYRLPKCIQRDPALQDMVQDRIVEVVGGMFLLARLHTDLLLDKRTPKDVKSALAKLSKGSAALHSAYGDALQRIEGQLDGDCELAKKVLSWITFAKRPLTTAEICCALAVEPDEKELDLENILEVEDLVSVCAGLVVVDQESAVIRLVHYTTQQYFESIKGTWCPAAPLHIATTCLTYLSFSAFRSGSCSTDREFEERLRRSEFLDYAAKHWGQHMLAVQEKVCELACVHLTARFGLPSLSEQLLARLGGEIMIAVNAKDSWNQTPLFLAVEHGHYKMAKLLLDKGTDVNAQGTDYGNPLQAASYRGDEQVIKLLLDKGANVNAQGGLYGSALQAASYGGHEQIVKLLLDKGADINVQGSYGNALQVASLGGHKQITKLLLDKGADINAQGKEHSNALYAALLQGDEQTAKLLLDKGVNVNAQGGKYGSPLLMASYGGYEQIVKLLLDKGADINSYGVYGSALQAASYGGRDQLIKLLLDKGADVNTQGGYYGNALQAASLGGHEQIVKLLLDKGASVDFKDASNQTPLL
ncbi:hypothetical protein DL771_009336 [Monosporascus sp. 5C6A]|nr:hypothetical protein DL771_009336 [Monosporascus sp. 5C6A]